jgi:hypothetical protein
VSAPRSLERDIDGAQPAVGAIDLEADGPALEERAGILRTIAGTGDTDSWDFNFQASDAARLIQRTGGETYHPPMKVMMRTTLIGKMRVESSRRQARS